MDEIIISPWIPYSPGNNYMMALLKSKTNKGCGCDCRYTNLPSCTLCDKGIFFYNFGHPACTWQHSRQRTNLRSMTLRLTVDNMIQYSNTEILKSYLQVIKLQDKNKFKSDIIIWYLSWPKKYKWFHLITWPYKPDYPFDTQINVIVPSDNDVPTLIKHSSPLGNGIK